MSNFFVKTLVFGFDLVYIYDINIYYFLSRSYKVLEILTKVARLAQHSTA